MIAKRSSSSLVCLPAGPVLGGRVPHNQRTGSVATGILLGLVKEGELQELVPSHPMQGVQRSWRSSFGSCQLTVLSHGLTVSLQHQENECQEKQLRGKKKYIVR